MENIAIKIENVSKEYRLGAIGGGTLRGDLQTFWAKIRRKEDPNTIIGAAEKGKKGDRFMALNGVSFEVKKGEAIGIIGHNGAGKSTLLKLLCRVTAPSGGKISYNGRIASMLEVGTGFHPELTGRENVYMNGAILGMTKAEIDKKFDEIVKFAEMEKFIDTPVKRYSSGMYVKLAFSVAAHLDSEIMIMDEVLAVGDMAFQKKCLDKMREAAKKEGRTILYVSHNMNTIRKLCDRCIVLDKGKCIFEGDVEKAISVYLKNEVYEFGVNLDLSNKRMTHLEKKWKCKMTNLRFINKESPIFEINEIMNYELKINSTENLNNVSIRFEIRSIEDLPICTAIKQNCFSLLKGDNFLKISIDPNGLIPGKYKALIVIYGVNTYGGYEDYDAVYPTAVFEITDTHNQLGIVWSEYNWGKIKINNFYIDQ